MPCECGVNANLNVARREVEVAAKHAESDLTRSAYAKDESA